MKHVDGDLETEGPVRATDVYSVLATARNRINRPSKWISYWSVSNDGKRLCAYGAIADQCDDWQSRTPEQEAALRLLASETGLNPRWSPVQRVIYFNGDGRRHRDVMGLYERAINQARWEEEYEARR